MKSLRDRRICRYIKPHRLNDIYAPADTGLESWKCDCQKFTRRYTTFQRWIEFHLNIGATSRHLVKLKNQPFLSVDNVTVVRCRFFGAWIDHIYFMFTLWFTFTSHSLSLSLFIMKGSIKCTFGVATLWRHWEKVDVLTKLKQWESEEMRLWA